MEIFRKLGDELSIVREKVGSVRDDTKIYEQLTHQDKIAVWFTGRPWVEKQVLDKEVKSSI